MLIYSSELYISLLTIYLNNYKFYNMKITHVRLGESDTEFDSAPKLIIEGARIYLETNGEKTKVNIKDFKIYILSCVEGTVFIIINYGKGALVYHGVIELPVDNAFFQANKANIMADNIDIYANSHIDGEEYFLTRKVDNNFL